MITGEGAVTMKRLAFVLALVIFSFCTTGEKMRTVDVGDSEEGFVSKLGRPDGQEVRGDTVFYFYTNRLISGWSWDRADYYAKFLNRKLVEYGTGNVRQGMQRVWIAVP